MNALRRAKAESHDGASLEAAILRQGKLQNEAGRARFTAGFLSLTPTEQAVMSRLITTNKNFRAFDADALKPRNGSWTDASVRFMGLPARRNDDAGFTLRGGATPLGSP